MVAQVGPSSQTPKADPPPGVGSDLLSAAVHRLCGYGWPFAIRHSPFAIHSLPKLEYCLRNLSFQVFSALWLWRRQRFGAGNGAAVIASGGFSFMANGPSPRVNLRALILLPALLAILSTLFNDLYAIYRIQREVFVQYSLEANRAYAAKVALTIDQSLRDDLDRLTYTSRVIGQDFHLESLRSVRLLVLLSRITVSIVWS